MLDLRSILTFPGVYRLLQRLVHTRRHIACYVREYIRAEKGFRVLDIGCGPADILEYLPEVEYVGFDMSPEYIEYARKRFGNRGRFFCGKVSEDTLQERATFDLVLASNVLHHLDDEEALGLFRLANTLLKPGGRLVTCDGCRVKGDRFISRIFLDLDRGQHVRSVEGYTGLASKVFDHVKYEVRSDLSNLPMTGIAMQCTKLTTESGKKEPPIESPGTPASR